jgi:peptide/nickel transport system ATP-binding protein
MQEKLLDIKNLEVIYSADRQIVHAINNISLSMNKGETLGLVGETGAGKTTLALTLLRLLPKQNGKIVSGEVFFQGHDLIKATEADMRLVRGSQISMIFQDPMSSLNPVLTVGEQIAEAIRLHMNLAKDQVENRVEEMLRLVGIMESRKNDYPHQFSGGMKQRVVIAIALACEPDLLLADEPTTALDVTIQAQILDMMQELKDKINTSILLITHDLGVVAEFCDKVAIMYAGEIVEYGTAHDIYEGAFNHPYTKGLFGSIPDIHSNAERLNPIEGLMPDPTSLPTGCKFHPRCPKSMEICMTEAPTIYEETGHRIQCHYYASKAYQKE